MPKIVDKSLNERIRRFIDTSKSSHQAIDRLHEQLLQPASPYASNIAVRESFLSPSRRTRSVSPIRAADEAYGASALKARRDEDLKTRLEEVERELKKKDREVGCLDDRRSSHLLLG